MSPRFARLTMIAIDLLVTVTTVIGQAPAPGSPTRQPSGGGTYHAPRTGDGKPNLNGIWQALNTANWDIEAHAAAPGLITELGASIAVPGGLGVVEGEIPYKPEALAKKKANYTDRLKLDPENKCYLPGVPRGTYMPFPFQILQSQKHIMIVHEFAGAVRTIYMENQTPAPADSWMGWSNGRWDGKTLVVDTTNFSAKSNFMGSAANLHLVERFTRIAPDEIRYEVTVEDPSVWTRAWTAQVRLRRTDEALYESACHEGNLPLEGILAGARAQERAAQVPSER